MRMVAVEICDDVLADVMETTIVQEERISELGNEMRMKNNTKKGSRR